jgi:hypothetical protein
VFLQRIAEVLTLLGESHQASAIGFLFLAESRWLQADSSHTLAQYHRNPLLQRKGQIQLRRRAKR